MAVHLQKDTLFWEQDPFLEAVMINNISLPFTLDSNFSLVPLNMDIPPDSQANTPAATHMELDTQHLSSTHQEPVPPNNLKNREFDKGAFQIFFPGRATVFTDLDRETREKNLKAKPTESKTNSSSCLGLHVWQPPPPICNQRTCAQTAEIFQKYVNKWYDPPTVTHETIFDCIVECTTQLNQILKPNPTTLRKIYNNYVPLSQKYQQMIELFLTKCDLKTFRESLYLYKNPKDPTLLEFRKRVDEWFDPPAVSYKRIFDTIITNVRRLDKNMKPCMNTLWKIYRGHLKLSPEYRKIIEIFLTRCDLEAFERSLQ